MNHDHLASALRMVVSDLHKRLRKQIYTTEGLSMTEFGTLSHLGDRPSWLPSELAALTKVRAQSMTKVLRKLEAGGLIQLAAHASDKRKTTVALTEAGRQLLTQVRYERDEWLAKALAARLSAAETAALTELLPVLRRIADAD